MFVHNGEIQVSTYRQLKFPWNDHAFAGLVRLGASAAEPQVFIYNYLWQTETEEKALCLRQISSRIGKTVDLRCFMKSTGEWTKISTLICGKERSTSRAWEPPRYEGRRIVKEIAKLAIWGTNVSFVKAAGKSKFIEIKYKEHQVTTIDQLRKHLGLGKPWSASAITPNIVEQQSRKAVP